MNYQIYSKNLLVTYILRQYLDERFQHVDKLQAEVISCRVDLSRDEHHKKGDVYRAEINLNIPHKLLRVVEISNDIRASIDLAIDKLSQQLKKAKDRNVSGRRRISKLWHWNRND